MNRLVWPLLAGLLLLGAASAVTLTGQGTGGGGAAAGQRLSAWLVTPFGQPVQSLADTALGAGDFSLILPEEAPPARLLTPVDNRVSWPGLVDFVGSSAPASAAEVKFFVYRDANANGKRDEGEALREVRLGTGGSGSAGKAGEGRGGGKGELFVIWASAATTVRGSGGYLAELRSGWNLLSVEVRNPVRVTPSAGKDLDLR